MVYRALIRIKQAISIFKDWFNCGKVSGRGANRFVIPATQTTLFQNSMQYTAIKTWNEYFPKIKCILDKPNLDERKTKYEIFTEACKEIIMKERKLLFM